MFSPFQSCASPLLPALPPLHFTSAGTKRLTQCPSLTYHTTYTHSYMCQPFPLVRSFPGAFLSQQNVLRAQAVADSQRARLHAAAAAGAAAAAAAGGAGGPGGGYAGGSGGPNHQNHQNSNMLGMAVGGGYDEAVQLGMAGEWVHGLMRGTRDEAGEAGGEDALSLFMRTADDPNVVLEGGFEDPEPAPGAVPHPGGFGRGAPAGGWAGPGGGVAGEGEGGGKDGGGAGEVGGGGGGGGSGSGAAAPAAPAEEPDDWELELAGLTGAAGGGEAAAATGAKAGGGGGGGSKPRPRAGSGAAGGGSAAAMRPELLQMSGYQPRLGLLAIEVEDDETLSAMCEYLGW